jgi:hypothetical protein
LSLMMPRLHRASSRLFPLLVILAIISRVLVTSGLTAAAAGGESFYRWANTRLEFSSSAGTAPYRTES